MSTARLLRPSANCLKSLKPSPRRYTTPTTPPTNPRHFLSIADLTPLELTTLVRNAAIHKSTVKSSGPASLPRHLHQSLAGHTLALMFTKRSTRTRVSSEAAISMLGGHPLFLGSADIQLGVNESLHDSSVVISSMVSAMVARVDAHSDITQLAAHSSKPVINALSDSYHPLQAIADTLTLSEAFPSNTSSNTLGLEGLKIAWVGDANNVLFDLAIAAAKLGLHLSVATPKGYGTPPEMLQHIHASAAPNNANFRIHETNIPEEAVKDADVLVTDTWISMGQESAKAQKLKDFAGFQITAELAQRGGAKEGWRFMHCLPRKPEEVSDEVFFDRERSLVWTEAENRLWGMLAVLEGFVVKGGKID